MECLNWANSPLKLCNLCRAWWALRTYYWDKPPCSKQALYCRPWPILFQFNFALRHKPNSKKQGPKTYNVAQKKWVRKIIIILSFGPHHDGHTWEYNPLHWPIMISWGININQWSYLVNTAMRMEWLVWEENHGTHADKPFSQVEIASNSIHIRLLRLEVWGWLMSAALEC